MKRFFLLILIVLFFNLAISCASEDADIDGDTNIDGDNDTLADGDTEADNELEGSVNQCPTGYLYNPASGMCQPLISDGDFDDDAIDEEERYVSEACKKIVDGWNRKFMVDDLERDFLLDLPDDINNGDEFAVIFNWHGYGVTASNMSRLLSGSLNNLDMPFILVSPEDTNLMPTKGLDWAILKVDNDNQDAKLFDEILVCLSELYDIDTNHIHSVGFSAGAIMTDVLGVTRGDKLASILTYSGIYFSNDLNDSGLDDWIALSTENKFVQVLLHGDSRDNWQGIQFDTMGKSDIGYLNENGHDVIHCDHGGKHTIPGGFQANQIIRFFADHPLGTTNTPYTTGLPANFPDYCEVNTKD